MKLFRISQNVHCGYDTYSMAIVCAKNKKEAQGIHPDSDFRWDGELGDRDDWCAAKDVNVEYIGEAKINLRKGKICASFHVG